MLSDMSALDIAEWEAYYQIEPFGEYQTNYAAGVIASTFANIHRKKGARAYKPEDFMPERKLVSSTPKKQSVEQQALILRQIASTHKKKGVQKKRNKKRKRKK